MRAMLSFTICGGPAVPWARTAGACMARARPTAVVNVEAANRRRFMTLTSPLRLGARLNGGRFDGCLLKVTGACKNCFLPPAGSQVYLMQENRHEKNGPPIGLASRSTFRVGRPS